MNKEIKIIEIDDDVRIEAAKGLRWSTFYVGMGMLAEAIIKESNLNVTIDDILDDVKRLYLRDNEEGQDNSNGES